MAFQVRRTSITLAEMPINDKIVGHTTHAAYNALNALDGTSVYVSPTNGAVGLFGTGAAAGVAAPTAASIALA